MKGEGMARRLETQATLFDAPAVSHELRDRIVAALADRFPCYGAGSVSSPRNPVGETLKNQPLQFAFGVHVADVVEAVLRLADTSQ